MLRFFVGSIQYVIDSNYKSEPAAAETLVGVEPTSFQGPFPFLSLAKGKILGARLAKDGTTVSPGHD